VLTGRRASGRDRPPKEDFARPVPAAVVLLDGDGYVPESGIGCVRQI